MSLGGRLNAQDIITLKNGDDLNAKVLEVLDGEIRYKRSDNPDGPVFTMRKSEILMITYQNGTRDVMNSVPSDNYTYNYGAYAQPAGRLYAMSPDVLRPNMSYRELRNIYSMSSWDGYRSGDQYCANWCWNFLLTGLGQMTMGEVGRGFTFLGAELGCYALASIGNAMVWDSDNSALGLLILIAGSTGAATACIWSMVDAAQIAKVKNMYARDMRELATGIDFRLSPWVSSVPAGSNGNYMTAAGLSLSMTF